MSSQNKANTFETLFRNIKLLSSEDIERLISMKEAISATQRAFASYSAGASLVPQRYISNVQGAGIDLFFKPAYNNELGRMALKILTQKTDGAQQGIPSILGVVLLLDLSSGAVISMMDGAYLTALRTGAASGIATKLLSRELAETVAIFGCGEQGKTQLEAVCNVRTVKKVLLFDKNIEAATKFKYSMEEKLCISINVEKDLQNLKMADIICTATNAEKPLFSYHDISAGVHINAIGSYKPNMQEIDPDIIRSSVLFVDSKESVLKESGDLIKPLSKRLFSADIIKAEIGDLINNKVKGRQSDKEITIFKSVGLGVQDLYVANTVYENHIKH